MEILKYPNPILREKCLPVNEFGSGGAAKSLNYLWSQMHSTMFEANGIGLAAPQVGHLERICVVDLGDENKFEWMMSSKGASAKSGKLFPLALINPLITVQKGARMVTMIEGCLSIPNIEAPVARPEIISVSFKDEFGNSYNLTCSGMLARAIMHEVDHLNGVLFIDRVSKKNLQAMDFANTWRKYYGDMILA